ncbi:MAG: GIY-YIG nuclease family protein [Bifidobacteriaceae bacterium]|nr:GIY-YIG nuclease family protein [Bifidobacteriaceae bacterium]
MAKEKESKSENASRGIVYIFTNPCLDGWVKIGMTDKNDIKDRIEELNSPANMPLCFRSYATYKVKNPKEVEGYIHDIIDAVDDKLHAVETNPNSGRERKREFFQMSAEKAYTVLDRIAKLRGDSDKLEVVEPTDEELKEQQTQRSTRKNFSFANLGIPIGAKLTFLYDDKTTCKVLDGTNHVTYSNEPTTLSAIAGILLQKKWKKSKKPSVQGSLYWKYEDETISDRRERLESEKTYDND